MQLNHLDLQVSDVQSTVAFFETCFDFELQTNHRSPAIAILSDRRGFVLVLQRRTGGTGWPEGFHLGFLVEDVQTVERTWKRLGEAGHAVNAPTTNNRGTAIYVRMPDGYLIEVSCRKTSVAAG